MIALTPREREIVSLILKRRLSHVEVWAFGSRVGGKPRPFSDLDLAILSPQPLPFGLLAELSEDFEEADLDFKVDLIDYSRLSPSWKSRINACHEMIS